MAVQAQRIALERDRANREAQTAKQVSDFLVSLFEVSQPSEAAANSVTAREILDKGANQIERELQCRPEVRAAMMSNMGRAYLRLGSFKKAEDLLEEALKLQRQAVPRSPEVGKGMLWLAEAIDGQGRHSDAERLLRDALTLLRGLPGSQDGTIAECLSELAFTLRGQAKYVDAEAVARESLGLYRQMPAPPPPQLATALGTLGAVLLGKADYAGAEPVLGEALDLTRKSLGPGHPTTLGRLKNLAVVWTYQGNTPRPKPPTVKSWRPSESDSGRTTQAWRRRSTTQAPYPLSAQIRGGR